jgi:predicted DNA-binding transcriptional regulator YafY
LRSSDEKNGTIHCGQMLAAIRKILEPMPNDPTARALQLLSLLQTYKFWPGEELAQRLEVSGRTLRRDVDRLRELGYPVDATPGVSGGYRLTAGSHLPPLVLDDDEAVAIAVGLRAAASTSVAGIEDTALRAMAKLEQVLPDRLRRRVKAVHGNVSQLRFGGEGPTVDAEALAVLAQACRDHEQVRFVYQRRDGEDSRRLVEPHQLVSSGRRWYLAAWDVRRVDWRTFRLDRLSDPRLAGLRFTPRPIPGGDAAAFVAQSLGERPLPFTATVVVTAAAGEAQATLRWTDSRVEAIDATTCRVHLKSEAVGWLDTMVAMLAVSFPVEVEEPDALRERLGTLADRLAAASDQR